MSRKWRILGLGTAVAAAVVLTRGHPPRQKLEHAGRWLERQGRHIGGVLQGASYRLRGKHPDEDVIDLVLADRIRSELGPLQRRLDLPHVHVMVHGHTAVLHGDVADESDRKALEKAVGKVAGVQEVDSRLHVGLLPGDTRPSEGRAVVQPSAARLALESAARVAGVDGSPEGTIRAVLSTFLGRLPESERDQVLTHLPDDVRSLTEPLPGTDAGTARLRTVPDLIDAIDSADPSLDGNRARQVTEALLTELAVLVPEEHHDVAAVLPKELEEFWLEVAGQADASASRPPT